MTSTGTLLTPPRPRETWEQTEMGRFLARIQEDHGIRFEDYEQAWQWSVEHLEEFWQRVWDHFEVIAHDRPSEVLPERTMPRARWFPGATLNYTEHVLRALRENADKPMLVSRSQTDGARELTGAELLALIGRLQAGLKARGIRRGDRVAGYLPNIPEAVALYLAVTGLGAVWCGVPPEMGPQSVVDRLGQMEPSLLVAVDGYRHGRRELSRAEDLDRIRHLLPDTPVVVLPYLDPQAEAPEGAEPWSALVEQEGQPHIEPVPFDHPLAVLFSSGTTGRPKAIVHCHGGILLEHLKAHGLHFSMTQQDRVFVFSTTGWMVWNLAVSALLTGATLITMDGDPGYPSLDGEWSQWAVAAETEATYMLTGSAYLAACAHAGMRPGQTWDLHRLRELQCSGSPLAPDVAAWVLDAVNPDLLLAPTSGGTDICGAFVGASPLTGTWAGEMACRPLGVAVDSFDPEGRPLVGTAGELVCTLPMPSMPAFFWGDQDDERYHGSYFGAYPGVWRHGDWVIHTERGTWNITGRSDATLNRGGVRLGTAEFYTVLDGLGGVRDSMVMHLEDDGGMGRLLLLVDAAEDLDREELTGRIRTAIRTELSPRHVPDDVVYVPAIPRNATGKRLEIPLKRLVQAALAGQQADPGTVGDPEEVGALVTAVREALT